MKDLVKLIEEKKEKLNYISKKLKTQFFGIDQCIDKIISSIESWYCMPDILTRPTIICLWGLTGTGKTDLVRNISSLLDMSDNFVEVQMTNKGKSNVGQTTLKGVLDHSNISYEHPGILLLDEIQRFRTIENEKEIHDSNFQDVWMLLSDGSFGQSNNIKNFVLDQIYEDLYWQDYYKTTGNEDEDEGSKQRKYKRSIWSARTLKRELQLTDSIEKIMEWSKEQKIAILKEKIRDNSFFRERVYSKVLIFISGNIDEVYRMSDMVDEVDIDADILHKKSLSINLIDIKNALLKRFKPEQIARFGNSHVIYPSLSKETYQRIIQKKCDDISKNAKTKSNVNIFFDDSVYDAIYRNGVFPAQGTRPVFSTISSMVENNVPNFVMRAIKNNKKDIKISYEDKCLVSLINNDLIKVKNEGEIDKIKKGKEQNLDLLYKVSVHESGHVLAYCLLYGYSPTQIVANTASVEKNGFIGVHEMDECYLNSFKKIQVYLAGRVAEEIIFGKELVTHGCISDFQSATNTAASMIRKVSMDEYVSYISANEHYNTSVRSTNKNLEKLIRDAKEKIHKLISDKSAILAKLSLMLVKQKEIKPKQLVEFMADHGIKVEELDAKEKIYASYRNTFDKFVKEFV